MPEVDFIEHMLKNTGCGLLLDATNVYTNARKFGVCDWRLIAWCMALVIPAALLNSAYAMTSTSPSS